MLKIKVDIKVKCVDFVFRDVPFHVYADGKVHRLDNNTWPSDNRPDANGYIIIRIKGKGYKLHRVVYSALVEDVMDSPEIQIDHRNGNRLDNSIANLRQATHAENTHNRSVHCNSTSGVANISAKPCRKKWGWEIRIRCDGQDPFYEWRTMGPLPKPDPLPPVPQDLIDIRNRECIRMFGEFARLV